MGRAWLGRRAGSRLLVLARTEGYALSRMLRVCPPAHRSPQGFQAWGDVVSFELMQEVC